MKQDETTAGPTQEESNSNLNSNQTLEQKENVGQERVQDMVMSSAYMRDLDRYVNGYTTESSSSKCPERADQPLFHTQSLYLSSQKIQSFLQEQVIDTIPRSFTKERKFARVRRAASERAMSYSRVHHPQDSDQKKNP